jgi:hypothetical protein
MKKQFSVPVILIATIIYSTLTCCQRGESSLSESSVLPLPNRSNITSQTNNQTSLQGKEIKPTVYIPVDKKNFEKLVSFIERKGYLMSKDGRSCDHEIIFFDKESNCHEMKIRRLDSNGKPSWRGSVKQISVIAHRKGILSSENEFSYVLTIGDFSSFDQDLYPKLIVESAIRGYEDLLVKANS